MPPMYGNAGHAVPGDAAPTSTCLASYMILRSRHSFMSTRRYRFVADKSLRPFKERVDTRPSSRYALAVDTGIHGCGTQLRQSVPLHG